MSNPFSSIRKHLLVKVFSKVDPGTYFKLLRINYFVRGLCQNLPVSVEIKIDHLEINQDKVTGYCFRKAKYGNFDDLSDIHVRVTVGTVFIAESLKDNAEAQATTLKLRRKYTTTESISFQKDGKCDPSVVQLLLETLRPAKVEFQCLCPASYFQKDALKKVKELSFNQIYIEKEDFLSLRAESIICKYFIFARNNIEPSFLYCLFKDWFGGKRNAPYIRISREYADEEIEEIIADVPFNVVWTPVHHNHSILSCLGDVAQECGDLKLFSIHRPSEAFQPRHLLFFRGSLKFVGPSQVSEKMHLLVHLPRHLGHEYRQKMRNHC